MGKFGSAVGVLLVLVGLLAGGCSLFFTPFVFGAGFGIVLLIWIGGLLIGIFGIMGGYRMIVPGGVGTGSLGGPYQPQRKGEDDERP